MRVVVALGGNALLRRGERPDSAIQREHVAEVAPALAALATDHQVVIVHGNGPQVGMLALESAADENLTEPYPFSDLVAETQGVMGYWLQQGLSNAGLASPAVTLISQTVVDPDDPAFEVPTKFVGAVYDEPTAHELAHRHGWTLRPDGPGWRRVVPSPLPQRIVEIETARRLLELGTTVVLCGGGGVPVRESPSGFAGIDAVVDKDFVAALVATELKAELLVMLTDVPGVFAGFGTPEEHLIGQIGPDELAARDFPAGSMGPKIAASCRFVRETGGRAAIGDLAAASAVIEGSAGTQIHP